MFKVGDIVKFDPKQLHKVDQFWWQMWGANKDTLWKVVHVKEGQVTCVHVTPGGKVPRLSNGEWTARASFVVPAAQPTKEELVINKIKYLNEKYAHANLRYRM